MKANSIIIIAALAGLSACGPSREEMAIREQFKTDSISKAAQEELLNQQRIQERRTQLKLELVELKSKLAGAKQKMDHVLEFDLFRTDEEKTQQVESQTKIIESLELMIEETKAQLN